jgi:hypothetical protein
MAIEMGDKGEAQGIAFGSYRYEEMNEASKQ